MIGQDTEIRSKDEKIKITSRGKTQFKGNLVLHTNNQINDKEKATHKTDNQTQKSKYSK